MYYDCISTGRRHIGHLGLTIGLNKLTNPATGKSTDEFFSYNMLDRIIFISKKSPSQLSLSLIIGRPLGNYFPYAIDLFLKFIKFCVILAADIAELQFRVIYSEMTTDKM